MHDNEIKTKNTDRNIYLVAISFDSFSFLKLIFDAFVTYLKLKKIINKILKINNPISWWLVFEMKYNWKNT